MVSARMLLLAVLASGFALGAETIGPREALVYSGANIVNAADNVPGPLAPNTIATIYGTGLAYNTRALSLNDISAGLIPNVLPGTGVRVLVAGLVAGIYYVSPKQINFLVPAILVPGWVNVQVALDGLAGPSVQVQIAAASPALFQLDLLTPIATRADGSLITADLPVKAGDYAVFYLTGLGAVVPPLRDREIPTAAMSIKQMSGLKLTLDGREVDAAQIGYAGVSPGSAGLYQINLKLPDWVGQNPEIRVSIGDSISAAGLRLPVQP